MKPIALRRWLAAIGTFLLSLSLAVVCTWMLRVPQVGSAPNRAAVPLHVASLPRAPMADNCWAMLAGDTTVYSSSNASAVQQAIDAASPGDTIKVAGFCPGVQGREGTSQTLYISQTLTVQGGYTLTDWSASNPVSYPTTLDAQSEGRVVYVVSGSVTLDGLNLTAGNVADNGGGIYTEADLTVTHSIVFSNSAVMGSGIYVASGSRLTVDHSTLHNNTGAASALHAVGIAQVSYSIISNNTGSGIVHISPDNFSLAYSMILSNTRFGLENVSGSVTIQASTIAYNSSNGIASPGFAAGTSVSMTNSTIAYNNGYGIDNLGSELYIINSTVAGNRSYGIRNDNNAFFSATVVMSNTLIAQNGGSDCRGSGDYTSQGYNLDGDGSCHLVQPTDWPTTTLTLGPLQDNGGSTWTRAARWPAVNNGDCAGGRLAVDQRGVARPQWGVCDIGAYEYDDDSLIVTDDNFSTTSDTRISRNVTNNDFTILPTLTVTLLTSPTYGTIEWLSSGLFTYIPNASFAGSESFTYMADNGVQTDTATVTLTTYPVNTPPVEFSLKWIASRDASVIAPADVDSDGDLDVAVIDDSVRLYVNQNGALPDATAWEASGSAGAVKLAWGDVDRDGDLDLAVAIFGTNKLYLNTGGAMETEPAWTSAEGYATQDIAWGDIDGDGWLDLIAGGPDGYQVYLSDAGNLPALPSQSSVVGADQLALGDMDGDGRLDLATSHLSETLSIVSVFSNTGGAFAQDPAWDTITSNHQFWTAGIAWGDRNNDGWLDLAVAEPDAGAQVYINTHGSLGSTAAWTWSPPSPPTLAPTNVKWGDVNSDGLLDLLVDTIAVECSSNCNSRVLLFTNAVDGLNTEADWITVGPWQSTMADIDNDGLMDILTGGPLFKLYLNTQPPVFEMGPQVRFPLWDAKLSMAWGDVDNDGDVDLAVGNQLYLNENGQIQTPSVWTGPDATSLAWGDADGDGALDLAVGGLGASQIFLNDSGVLSATARWNLDDVGYTEGIAWGDVDNDGDLDLAVADFAVIGLYFNHDGAVDTGASWIVTDSTDNRSLAWGDVDNDGDLDLVVAGLSALRLYMNHDGSLETTPAWQSAGGDNVDWGDYDRDGDLDLAVGSSGPTRVYANREGALDTTPIWTSLDIDPNNTGVKWADLNADGYMELLVFTMYGMEPPASSRLYANVKGVLQPTSKLDFAPRLGAQLAGSLADVDHDGDWDIAFYVNDPSYFTEEGLYVYYNKSEKPGVAPVIGSGAGVAISLRGDAAATFNGQTAYALAPADEYALAHIRQSIVIPITYTIFNQPALQVRGFYALNGEGDWLPAQPTTDTITTHVPAGAQVYQWDTFASGFFGQSDNLVFRLEWVPGGHTANGTPGVQQRPYIATQTFPFRVRGTQVRVMSGTLPVQNAMVYRLPKDQLTGGALMGNGEQAFVTNAQGYLQGRGQIEIGDTLLAIAPVTSTDTYNLYYTNGAPNENGVTGYVVDASGVQTITVSAAHPLFLFNLDVSLEWDAHNDAAYLEQLQANLVRASEYLYDFTDGQVALGAINVFQNADEWTVSHVVINANNHLRPFAAQGGVVVTDTVDPQHADIRYMPGQVSMGSTWNRYGNPGQSLGDDWALILAHELSHYLLFHDDTYLGLDDDGFLIPITTCLGSAMGDLYGDPEATEFIADESYWQAACADTLPERTLGRNEWETLRLWYPALVSPTIPLTGPVLMPFDFTAITLHDPYTPTTVLVDPTFYASYAGGGNASSEARAYLFSTATGGDYVVNLGSPYGGQNRVLARGARPGDRLCVFDRPRAQFGCETIALGNDRLSLRQDDTWNPVIQLTPLNTVTLNLSMTVGTPITWPLYARLFPELGYGVAPVTLTLSGGIYTAAFHLDYPTLAGHLQVWVDEPATESTPRRETVAAFNVGGNPGFSRGGGGFSRGGGGFSRDGGGFSRGGGGFSRGGGAPLISPDGQLIFFTENPGDFITGTLFAIQAMAGVPPLPSGRTLVGQGYALVASPGATLPPGSVSLQYLSNDVLVAGAQEDQLGLYFWDGTAWTALDTTQNEYFNLVTAPSQGPGFYALLASIQIPLIGPGWNNFAYPVAETRPVSDALLAISGFYTTVYGYAPTDLADHWKVFDVTVPEWVNDLHTLEFGKGYWINVSENITLHLASGTQSAIGGPQAAPYLPATYYGEILASSVFTPAAGMSVTAWISGTLCGQTAARAVNGRIVYAVDVEADAPDSPGCGAPGSRVSFQVNTRLVAPIMVWGIDHLWEVSLRSITPPTAQDDDFSTLEDAPITLTVLENDYAPDGGPLTVTAFTLPGHGVAVISGTTTLLYTPTLNFNGVDGLTYTIVDGDGLTDTATVTITVTPVNDSPDAVDDSANTAEDTPRVIAVLGNDTDPDAGDVLTVIAVGRPISGTASTNGATVTYTPTLGFNGTDVFTYTIADTGDLRDTATVTITVGAVNDPPNARDDIATTDEDTSVSIAVLSNDSDPDGDTLVLVAQGVPGHGVVAAEGNEVVYTPTLNFNGTDAFTYTLSDGDLIDTATVTVTVAPVNDSPDALDDSANTTEDTPRVIAVLGNDTDPDADGGDVLTVIAVGQPISGTASTNGATVTYTPTLGFNGTDVFTYTIADTGDLRDTATVTVAVGAVNDPPNAHDDTATTAEDTPVNIAFLSNDTDPDGDTLILVALGVPSHGVVAAEGNEVVYTPTLNFNGTDAFTYTVSDGNLTDSATVTITVTPVNDPPTISDIPDQTVSVNRVVGPLLFTVDDVETASAALTVTAVTANPALAPDEQIVLGSSGLMRTLTLTPTTGMTGTAVITVSVSDGIASTSDAFLLTVVEGGTTHQFVYLPLVMRNL